MAAEGYAIGLRERRLTALETATDNVLQRAIGKAIRGGPWGGRTGAEVSLPAFGQRPLLALIAPLGGDNPFTGEVGPARAAVYLLDQRQKIDTGIGERRLRLVFGLTAAEGLVAGYIIAGASPEEIAETRGRSLHTVRAQVRSILSKADLRRIGDLQALRSLVMFAVEA